MLKKLIIFLIYFSIFLTSQSFAEIDLTELVKKVQPAVVTVLTYDDAKRLLGIGSGFFINKKGDVITNHHVLEGAYEAEVKTYDGRRFLVKLVLAEHKDVDLIKVGLEIPHGSIKWLKVSSVLPSIAERVIVIGNPQRLEGTVSDGIVSAIRQFPKAGEIIQISAPISKGSSGGPVVNLKGEVMGVVTSFLEKGQNLNFAVPGKYVIGLKHKEINKPFWEWAYKDGLSNEQWGKFPEGSQRSEELTEISKEGKERLEKEWKRLVTEFDEARKRLNNKKDQLDHEIGVKRKHLEIIKQELDYEHQALINEGYELNRSSHYLQPEIYNQNVFNLNVKWRNYELRRRAFNADSGAFNEWVKEKKNAFNAEVDEYEKWVQEKEKAYDAEISDYNDKVYRSNYNREVEIAEKEMRKDRITHRKWSKDENTEIYLKNGKIIKTSSWWEENDTIMYEKFGGFVGISKSKIKEIIRIDE